MGNGANDPQAPSTPHTPPFHPATGNTASQSDTLSVQGARHKAKVRYKDSCDTSSELPDARRKVLHATMQGALCDCRSTSRRWGGTSSTMGANF